MTAHPQAADAAQTPRVGRLASAALLLSASFVLSRVLGVVRNSAIGAIFGTSHQVDAYFAAFRIPDTIFMLVSGGALASAFVPVFAGLLERGDEREAWHVASSVLNSVAVALAAFSTLAFIFAPLIMSVLVQGQGFSPDERTLTVELTRLMLLQPIFLGIAAIVTAILQTYHRFVLTAVAPLLYNAAVIVGALALGPTYGVRALAWVVVLGALAQLLVQLPGLWPEARTGLARTIRWTSPEAREVLKLFGPRVVGLAAFQAMLLVTLFLAARLPKGNWPAINYAWPLIMFPIGALGTAAATAIFPTLSRLSATEDRGAIRRTVDRGLRVVIFLAIPASVGLIVLRRPVVNLLYNHGQWTSTATEQTAFALLFYALAIAPMCVIEVAARVFYSMRDTISPVRIAVVAVTLDAALSVLFVQLFPPGSRQGGLALATAIATLVQAVWLASAMERRLGEGQGSVYARTVRDGTVASVVMGMVLYVALDPLTAVFGQSGVGVVVLVAVELLLGLSSFGVVAYLLGAPELYQVRGLFLRRR